MNFCIFGMKYTKIMFLACGHLTFWTVELSEIHILTIKIKLINYILIDYKVISPYFSL